MTQSDFFMDIFVPRSRIKGGFFDLVGLSPFEFHDDSDHRYLTMDVPGYEPEEISVEIEQGVLYISVEIEQGVLYISGRHESKDSDGKVWQNINFTECVTLPPNVDQNSLVADLRNGRLTVTLLKVAPDVKKFEVRKL